MLASNLDCSHTSQTLNGSCGYVALALPDQQPVKLFSKRSTIKIHSRDKCKDETAGSNVTVADL